MGPDQESPYWATFSAGILGVENEGGRPGGLRHVGAKGEGQPGRTPVTLGCERGTLLTHRRKSSFEGQTFVMNILSWSCLWDIQVKRPTGSYVSQVCCPRW